MKDKSTKNTINTRKNSKRPCRRIHRRLTRWPLPPPSNY